VKLVCAAFDRDGGLVDGTQRDVDLRLQDATLAHLLTTGLNLRGQLKVSAGTYALRMVVYEVDSARMTALNRARWTFPTNKVCRRRVCPTLVDE
jgi:hypothetical protein